MRTRMLIGALLCVAVIVVMLPREQEPERDPELDAIWDEFASNAPDYHAHLAAIRHGLIAIERRERAFQDSVSGSTYLVSRRDFR